MESSLTIFINPNADMGYLSLDILEAENLEAVDSNGTSDPYCVVMINQDKVHKTKIHKKTLNPVFNETCEKIAIVSRQRSKLVVEVKDFNKIQKHVTLGTVSIQLSRLVPSQVITDVYRLEGARSGTIKLRLYFEPGRIEEAGSKKVSGAASTISASFMAAEGNEGVATGFRSASTAGNGSSPSLMKRALGGTLANLGLSSPAPEKAVMITADLDKEETAAESSDSVSGLSVRKSTIKGMSEVSLVTSREGSVINLEMAVPPPPGESKLEEIDSLWCFLYVSSPDEF
ncbi:hypothetical protein HK102_012336 [Quaeritorhiza haematococci]|nr:hypothetical protein HK102_012336 [Quaeritorhiza haematococci]